MKKKKKNMTFNSKEFDVAISNEGIRIFEIVLAFFVILFIVFAIMYIFKIGRVTKGNLYVFAVLSGIVLLFILQFKTWKLSVKENKVSVNGIYRRKVTFTFEQIDKIVVGKKNELKVYVSGKKITTIDWLCVHYDEFIEIAKYYKCNIIGSVE
ncbi:DUF6560 family protein [Anaerosporobacter sp.]